MAIIGHGTTLSGSVSNAIGEVITMGTSASRDAVDVSSMDSANQYRQFIAGMQDAGEITAEINYVAAEVNVLETALETEAAETWTITFPDTNTYVASGILTGLDLGVPFDDKVTASITIKLTGAIDYTITP